MKSFTIVELLVVLSIISLLMTMPFQTLYSVIGTQQLVQSGRSVVQDIRLARLQAMNLKRLPNDSWVYGVGFVWNKLSTDATYGIFNLEPTSLGSSKPSFFMPYPNGIPTFLSQGISTDTVKYLPGKQAVQLLVNVKNTTLKAICTNGPLNRLSATDNGNNGKLLTYLIFESLSGDVHAYYGDTQNPQSCGTTKYIVIYLENKVATHKIIIDHENGDDIYLTTQ